jgi:hypothetical protein
VKKELEIKNELKFLLSAIFIIIIILKIAFYKENLINIIKLGLSFIYFSLFPGYFILYYITNNISKEIRLVLSFPVGLAIYSVITFYLNMFIHINYILFLPIIIVLISIILIYYKFINKK